MTGFWNPIAVFLLSAWSAFARALVHGIPMGLRPKLAAIERPRLLAIQDHEDIWSLEGRIDHAVVDVIFRGQLVLTHSFLLPLAAKADIKNAVRLEVERVMPLDSRLVYYGFKVRNHLAGEDCVVDVYIVRRQIVDKTMAIVSTAGGVVRKIALSGNDANGQVKLLFRAVQVRNLARTSIILLLVASAVYGLALLPGIYQSQIEAAISDTDEAILASRAKTMKIASLQNQVRVLESLSTAVAERRQASRILDLFTQLTNASPDSVMIESFSLNGNRLAIRGTAVAPEDWVVQLQRHAAFSDVALLSVIGLPENNRRRFEIRMDVIWPHARQKNEQ